MCRCTLLPCGNLVAMRGPALLLLLLGSLLPAALAALQLQPEEPQQSFKFSLPAAQNASLDLSLDEAPLVRGTAHVPAAGAH